MIRRLIPFLGFSKLVLGPINLGGPVSGNDGQLLMPLPPLLVLANARSELTTAVEDERPEGKHRLT